MNTQSRAPNNHGFTLIELIMTVLLAAVLAGVAAPSLRSFSLNNRLKGTASELLSSMQAARTHASKNQNNVVLCMTDKAVSDPDNATCATGGITGWIVFLDFNGNWDRDLPGDSLFEVHTFENDKVHLLADNSKKLSFAKTGFANPTGSTPSTQTASTAIVVCDSRGNLAVGNQSVARGLQIVNTGRARMTRTVSEVSSLLSTIGSSCPPT